MHDGCLYCSNIGKCGGTICNETVFPFEMTIPGHKDRTGTSFIQSKKNTTDHSTLNKEDTI